MLPNLKKIITDIDQEEMEIKTVAKTQNGNIIIELSKKCNQIKEFSTVITTKFTGSKILTRPKDDGRSNNFGRSYMRDP